MQSDLVFNNCYVKICTDFPEVFSIDIRFQQLFNYAFLLKRLYSTATWYPPGQILAPAGGVCELLMFARILKKSLAHSEENEKNGI